MGKVGDSGESRRQEGGGAECQAGEQPTPWRRRLLALARSRSQRVEKLEEREPKGSAPEVIFQLLGSVADRREGSLWLNPPPPLAPTTREEEAGEVLELEATTGRKLPQRTAILIRV